MIKTKISSIFLLESYLITINGLCICFEKHCIIVQVLYIGDISIECRMTDYFQKRWIIYPVNNQGTPQVDLDWEETSATGFMNRERVGIQRQVLGVKQD